MLTATMNQANKLTSLMAKYQAEIDTLRGMKQILASAPDAPFIILYEPTQKKVLIPKAKVNNILNDALDKYTALLATAQAEFAAL